MACRAGAYLDDVPALGLQREILIESGHAVHLCRADAQLFRDQGQRSLAQVLILPLDLLHDRDQVRLIAAVGVDDRLRPVQILLHKFSPH
ncbi:Uncharacterised protein [uncultured Blautia sp.]|nr:Uncharacterised protein [uncultured Blautia sp.]